MPNVGTAGPEGGAPIPHVFPFLATDVLGAATSLCHKVGCHRADLQKRPASRGLCFPLSISQLYSSSVEICHFLQLPDSGTPVLEPNLPPNRNALNAAFLIGSATVNENSERCY